VPGRPVCQMAGGCWRISADGWDPWKLVRRVKNAWGLARYARAQSMTEGLVRSCRAGDADEWAGTDDRSSTLDRPPAEWVLSAQGLGESLGHGSVPGGHLLQPSMTPPGATCTERAQLPSNGGRFSLRTSERSVPACRRSCFSAGRTGREEGSVYLSGQSNAAGLLRPDWTGVSPTGVPCSIHASATVGRADLVAVRRQHTMLGGLLVPPHRANRRRLARGFYVRARSHRSSAWLLVWCD